MKSILQTALVLVAVFLLFSSALAEPYVVECEGKYVMGDLDSKKDAKTLALMEAKRIALERAGTHLTSTTEMKNFELTKDQVNTLAAGIISVEILKEDWQMSGENPTLTVKIRASIETASLEDRAVTVREDQGSTEEFRKVQDQLASLQRELNDLKTASLNKEERHMKHENLMKEVEFIEDLQGADRDISGGRYAEAMAGYERAVALRPDRPDAYIGQAAILHMTGRPDEAMGKIEKALQLSPGNAKAYAVKAAVHTDLKEYSKALSSITHAIKLNPRNPKFHSGRGEVYMKLNRTSLAIADFTSACRMGSLKACRRAKEVKSSIDPQSKRIPRQREIGR